MLAMHQLIGRIFFVFERPRKAKRGTEQETEGNHVRAYPLLESFLFRRVETIISRLNRRTRQVQNGT